jgi:NAD(P)H dehydrogenase (quinone)
MSEPLIAVTGATGSVGSRVTAALARGGARQRLLVRDPSRLRPSAGAEVRTIAGYDAFEDMRAALTGASTLYLVPAAEAPDRVAQHETVVRAAAEAGVQRIVYLSFFNAAPDATFTLARHHWSTERAIMGAGVPHTFLRMNLYADFLPSMVGTDGVIRGPAGDGRLSAILRQDVAAASAAVLLSEGHDGRIYDLTGGEAFTLNEAAAIMADVSGKPISFHDETDEEAQRSRAGFGAADWEIAGWISSYQAIRDGSLASMSDDVESLTGERPASLASYVRSNPEAPAHVHAA